VSDQGEHFTVFSAVRALPGVWAGKYFVHSARDGQSQPYRGGGPVRRPSMTRDRQQAAAAGSSPQRYEHLGLALQRPSGGTAGSLP